MINNNEVRWVGLDWNGLVWNGRKYEEISKFLKNKTKRIKFYIDANGGPPIITDGVTFIGNILPFPFVTPFNC